MMEVETNKSNFFDEQLMSIVQNYRDQALETYRQGDVETAIYELNIANVCANKLGYMKALTLEELIEE